jgi:hypothetical protein
MAVERPAPNAATGFANARAAGSRPLLVEPDMTTPCANLAHRCKSADCGKSVLLQTSSALQDEDFGPKIGGIGWQLRRN